MMVLIQGWQLGLECYLKASDLYCRIQGSGGGPDGELSTTLSRVGLTWTDLGPLQLLARVLRLDWVWTWASTTLTAGSSRC